eukprot:1318241-Amphidinium_carterae.1
MQRLQHHTWVTDTIVGAVCCATPDMQHGHHTPAELKALIDSFRLTWCDNVETQAANMPHIQNLPGATLSASAQTLTGVRPACTFLRNMESKSRPEHRVN